MASSDTPIIRPADDEIDLGDKISDLNSSMENEINLCDSKKTHEVRDISNVCERPNSLRLELVLEYTNRIKTFLGLQEEEKEPEENWQHESEPSEKNKHQEENTKRIVEEEPFIAKNFEKKDKDSASMNDETNCFCKPLPDIIGIQTESLKEAEQFPDILEQSKNVAESEPISETKVGNSFNSGGKNDFNAISTENLFLRNEEEPLPKTEGKIDAKDMEQDNGGASFFQETAYEEYKIEAPILKQEQDNVDWCDEKEITGKGEPYQITHIEEGLRQTEKTLNSPLLQEFDEPQTTLTHILKESEVQETILKYDSQEPDDHHTILENMILEADRDSRDTNPSTSLKGRSKLEEIRRLSTEVVNSVLQTANQEVNIILQNRDSLAEENNPIHADESLDDQEMILPLRDTEVEFHGGMAPLADIPEEKSSRTFSNITDISRESVATSSIEMKSVPVGSKHSIDRIEVTDEIDFDTQCGIGPFKPQCIQRYATANIYVILYSIIGILHGSYYTYLVGVLTTLEKRFEFKSKTSGFIMMLDELTPLFLGVLVGHFGGRAHRPRLLSFGMFLSAFCCFASALPYFLYGTATHLNSLGNLHNKTSIELCDELDIRIEHCDDDDRPPTVTAILLLMLGSFLKGFGNLAYYAIGLAYLDDNTKKRNTPLYFAVAFALRLLGPMVGFLMSSAFLKYYENPFETPDFGPDDPRWIGGWWMGFVLQGILLLIFAGPMALFPRHLPDHRPQLHEIEHNTDMFDGLGDSLKRLARNPLYMLIGLNAIFTVYGNFGYYIMLPKYMENQFRLSASSASLFAGPPGIAALMISCIIGGYLIWQFKPTAKMLAGGLVTLELISTVGYLILMIPQCEKIEMTHFGLGEESLHLEDACNQNCSCSTVQFSPVCGPDGKSYFSPCYAGCTFQQDQSFYNCSCLESGVVKKGLCTSENCWSQALAYIITLPVLQFIVNILRVAYTMIMLRSIRPEDKNIALGVFETVLSTVAFIPFPVLYGALVDSACLVWEKSCGETGNCWFYDIHKFNYLMHGGSAFFCGLSTLNLVAIFFLVNRIKDLYKDEEPDNPQKANTRL